MTSTFLLREVPVLCVQAFQDAALLVLHEHGLSRPDIAEALADLLRIAYTRGASDNAKALGQDPDAEAVP